MAAVIPHFNGSQQTYYYAVDYSGLPTGTTGTSFTTSIDPNVFNSAAKVTYQQTPQPELCAECGTEMDVILFDGDGLFYCDDHLPEDD